MFKPINRKLYVGLLIPALLLIVIFLFVLPDHLRYLIMVIPLFFWIIYYISVYFIDRRS